MDDEELVAEAIWNCGKLLDADECRELARAALAVAWPVWNERAAGVADNFAHTMRTVSDYYGTEPEIAENIAQAIRSLPVPGEGK